ncbi:MAG: SDR family oxidoreductase [Bacteroidetes bacterium]|nr:SDR family oxidoreductase [Bacteroidota bacterium]
MSTLKGKTVLITGASGGIGSEITREFARAGAQIIVHYAGRKEPARQLADEVIKGGGEAIILQADVRKSSDVKNLFDDAIAKFGKIDIVVNTAGIMITKLIKDTTDEDLEAQFESNINGTYYILREATTKLANNGSVINFSTSINRLMVPSYAAYAATKSAVETMSKVAAKEIGRGIRVNTVSPGPVDTPLFTNGKPQEVIDRLGAMSAFNRIGEPKDIAPVVVFLASDEAGWISGQNIGVNGAFA